MAETKKRGRTFHSNFRNLKEHARLINPPKKELLGFLVFATVPETPGRGWCRARGGGAPLRASSHSVIKSSGFRGGVCTAGRNRSFYYPPVSCFTRENTRVFWLYGQTRDSVLAVAPESWTGKGTLVGTSSSLESLKNQGTELRGASSPGSQCPGDRTCAGNTRALSLVPAL